MEPSRQTERSLAQVLEQPPVLRWLLSAAWFAIGSLCLVRFLHLSADFPRNSPWSIDQARFTDEGWYGDAAIRHFLTGHWYCAGDFNPAVALPVWPALLAAVFYFSGVSVVAARALNVFFSFANLGVVFLLARRHTRGRTASLATLAVLLLVSSPLAYTFSRLATLDTLVTFEFCLLLLLASFASDRRALFAIPVLVSVMALTKTTGLTLLPAVAWLTWRTAGGTIASLWRVLLSTVIAPAILLKGYAMLVFRLGFGPDYNYFFELNSPPSIEWNQTFFYLRDMLLHGLWIDRVLYPSLLIVLLYSFVRRRSLWGHPLFAASWLAIGGQAAFLLTRQGDVAPRYFLVMLVPVILLAVLALDTLRNRAAVACACAIVSVAITVNVTMIDSFQRHRQSEFFTAAQSIRGIVESDPAHNRLLLGISGSEISLMTGLPSINDAYGTQSLREKVLSYRPGWYVAWTGIGPDEAEALRIFRVDEISRYRVHGDEDRKEIILYRLTPR